MVWMIGDHRSSTHSYDSREGLMAVSASDARNRLFPLIQQVNDDHVPRANQLHER